MAIATNASPVERVARWTTRLVTGAALAYLVLPLAAIVPLSFSAGTILVFPLPGWSLRWYADFFDNPLWSSALARSVMIALLTMALATTLGTTAALGLQGARFRGKTVIVGLLVAPMAVPVIITAVALFYWLSALGLVGTYAGLVCGHTVVALPYAVVTVLAALQGLDPSLPRAAAVLGAAPLAVFRRVTLPLIWPGIAAGALFAFCASFDEVVITLFVASPQQRTLPRQIFSGVSEAVTPTVTAAAVVLGVVSIGLMLATELLRRRAARLRGTA
jgi:putative spermidine/putrescine transport system permease protein